MVFEAAAEEGSAGHDVVRVVCASVSRVAGAVHAEMEKARSEALKRYPTDGIHAMLVCQGGWVLYWAEGPAESIDNLLARMKRDPRHHSMRVLHRSRGPRLLPTPWSMMLAANLARGSSLDFARRVIEMQNDLQRNRQFSPMSVIRRLSAPLQLAPASGAAIGDPEAFHRVGISAAVNQNAFDYVAWLGNTHKQPVVQRRFSGTEGYDSGSDYVEYMGSAWPCRVIAVARTALTYGIRRAFYADWHCMVLLFSGDKRLDEALLGRLAEGLEDVYRRPALLGFAPDQDALHFIADTASSLKLDFSRLTLCNNGDFASVNGVIGEILDVLRPPVDSLWSAA
jgi:hypothetical protein